MTECRRTERANKGVNSQLHFMHPGDERLEKEARSKRWIFYRKGDVNSFPIEYNSCRWPANYTTASKMCLVPGDKVNLLYENVPIGASLSCRVQKEEVQKAEEVIAQKVALADHSLTDVSYLALVQSS